MLNTSAELSMINLQLQLILDLKKKKHVLLINYTFMKLISVGQNGFLVC